jgi:ATP-dependent DNA helicase RecG
VILLGVDDDGTLTGLTRARRKAEEWAMEVAREHLRPAVIPFWEAATEAGKMVGIIRLPADSPDKPYKAKRGRAWVTYVRVGSTSREATREEEARLYQASHLLRYDIKPVLGTGFESLDASRLENYFRHILRRDAPPLRDRDAWRRLLLNVDLLTEAAGATVATLGGLLLFGEHPNRHLPQAGITASAFPGVAKDYNMVDEELIRGPLVSLLSPRGRVTEKGVIDRAIDFVSRNAGSAAWLEGGRRVRKSALPLDAVRETIVNAVAHRDYTITGTDIEISLYQDRLEVISPGRLPNGVTIEKMKEGYRAARNELLKEILRDYGYVEHRGMGVRTRIIASMRAHNGTEPDLVEDDSRFTVRLWKAPRAQ